MSSARVAAEMNGPHLAWVSRALAAGLVDLFAPAISTRSERQHRPPSPWGEVQTLEGAELLFLSPNGVSRGSGACGLDIGDALLVQRGMQKGQPAPSVSRNSASTL